MLVREAVQDLFRQARRESYKSGEDSLETGGALITPKTYYNIHDLLKGESKKRWFEKFGDC